MPVRTISTFTNVNPFGPPPQVNEVPMTPAEEARAAEILFRKNAKLSASAKRKHIINVAKKVDKAFNKFKSEPMEELRFDCSLMEHKKSFVNKQKYMQSYDFEQLDNTTPPHSLKQLSRNAAALAAGAASRVGAAAVAGTVAAGTAAFGATAILAIPFAPCIGVEAAVEEWRSETPGNYTPSRNLGKSLKRGAWIFTKVATSPIWFPCQLTFGRGSLCRNTFRSLDRFPAAQANARRSTSSTKEIAMETNRKIAQTLENIEKKFANFPNARRTPMPLTSCTAWRGGDGYRCVVIVDGLALKAEEAEEAERTGRTEEIKCKGRVNF